MAAPSEAPPSPSAPTDADASALERRRAELGLGSTSSARDDLGGWIFFAVSCALVAGGLGWVFATGPAPRAVAPALGPSVAPGRVAEPLAPDALPAAATLPFAEAAQANPHPDLDAPADNEAESASAPRSPRAASGMRTPPTGAAHAAPRPPRGPSLGGLSGCGDDPLCGI